MKTTTIALSAAAMIVAAPVALAQNATSKTPGLHHQVSKKQVAPYATAHAMHPRGTQMGQPGAFGYAPSPKDYTLENSRQAGGGGGGGGGGSGM